MHHVREFFRSQSFTSSSGGSTAAATEQLAPHLAALGFDADTPIAEILESRAEGAGESKSQWRTALRNQFQAYLEVVYAANTVYFRHQLDDKIWTNFKRRISLSTLFSNKLWNNCDPNQQRTLAVPLLGKPSVHSRKSAGSQTTATLVAPKTAAADCMAVLEREKEQSLEMIRFMYRETRVRPAMTSDRILVAALAALTEEQIPSPFETQNAEKALELNAKVLISRVTEFLTAMEAQNTGADAVRQFAAHCRERVAAMRRKHGGEFKVDARATRLARWKLHKFAFDTAIDALRVTQRTYDSIPVPPRCLEETELGHLESRRNALERDIKLLAGQQEQHMAAVADIDTAAVAAARTSAHRDAMHLDLADFLQQIVQLCDEYVLAHAQDADAEEEGLAFIRQTLSAAQVATATHMHQISDQEDKSVSDISVIRPTLDACADVIAVWKSNVAQDSAVTPVVETAADSTSWFRHWMQIALPAADVETLEANLDFTVRKAKTVLRPEPLVHRQHVATLGADGMQLLTEHDKSNHTVTVVALIKRLLPWAGVFYTLDFIEGSASRKRKE